MKALRIGLLTLLALVVCGVPFYLLGGYHPHPRRGHAAVLLPDGRVLIVGGFFNKWEFEGFANFNWSFSSFLSSFQHREFPQNECDLFDPVSGKWTSGGTIRAPAGINQAASLGNGKVLANYVPQGEDTLEGPRESPLYLFDEKTMSWGVNPNPPKAIPENWTPLQGGKLLCQIGSDLAVFPYGSGHSIESCPFPCYHPVQLQDGRIFAYSGLDAGTLDLNTGLWTEHKPDYRMLPFPVLPSPPSYPSLVVLQNGNVLAAGGGFDGIPEGQCCLFNPKSGHWPLTGPMKTARDECSLILLRDGRVLALGGFQGGAACELYDPAPGTWSPTAPLDADRREFSTTQLQDGRVFIFGGEANGTALSTGEIYDPATGKWTRVD